MAKISATLAAANDLFPYDPCSICNLLLDEAGELPLTLQVMQTLLYFAHANYLIRTKRPLIFGHFEAMPDGPINPAAQEAFSAAGRGPIKFRALDEDLLRRTIQAPEVPNDLIVRGAVSQVIRTFALLPVEQILHIARAPEGPWAATINKARTSVVLGMRIHDSVILERFKNHKIVLGLPN
jgi:uncharacterized phage-associated protein